MWKLFILFLVVLPAAALTALAVGMRWWRRYPIGKARKAEAERAEAERVGKAKRELDQGGGGSSPEP
ncbi:MAG: hypothetical protein U0R50_02375 [Gaiellales bacterium]